MEVRTMFWTIAGLIIVGVIILVGVTLSGTLLQYQSCEKEDTYTTDAASGFGIECGDDIYCYFIDITIHKSFLIFDFVNRK